MPRTLEMPAFLTETGQQLWSAFIQSREHAYETQRELRTITPAMRRNSRPGMRSDPVITARYQAAKQAAEEAEAARQAAEHAYHAYRRVLLVRSQQRSASPRVMATTYD